MKIFLCISLLSIFTLPQSSFAKTICVGHRGNNVDELENSYQSFQSAAKLGASVEFDVRHTVDNVAIIMHDSRLRRTVEKRNNKCNLKMKIKKQNWNSIKSNCQLYDTSQIPSLKETLSLLSQYPTNVFIEFKDSPRLHDLEIVNKYYQNRGQNVYLISFRKKYLKKIKKWLPLFPKLKNTKILKLKLALRKNITLFDGADVRSLRLQNYLIYQTTGKIVGVWTKDSLESIKHYINLKVDFITTNNPRRCLSLL